MDYYDDYESFDPVKDGEMQTLFWRKIGDVPGPALTPEEEKKLDDYIDHHYSDAYKWDPEWFENQPTQDEIDQEEVRELYDLYHRQELTPEENERYEALVKKWGDPADDKEEYDDYDYEDDDYDYEDDDIDGDYEDDVPEYMYDPYTGSSWYESNNSWKSSNILTRL